jgi:hypothetical protein
LPGDEGGKGVGIGTGPEGVFARVRIELLRYRYYEDDIFILDPVTVDEKKISETKINSEKKETVVEWTVDRHLENVSSDVRQIFEQIVNAGVKIHHWPE